MSGQIQGNIQPVLYDSRTDQVQPVGKPITARRLNLFLGKLLEPVEVVGPVSGWGKYNHLIRFGDYDAQEWSMGGEYLATLGGDPSTW